MRPSASAGPWGGRWAFLTLVLLALVAGACAASGPQVDEVPGALASPPPGQGRIYFYRTEVPLFVALEPMILVNSRPVGRSVFGEAFYRDAYPGRYRAHLDDNPEGVIEFQLGAGEVRYVKTVLEIEISSDRLTLELVEAATARDEVADMTLVDPARKTPEKE